MAKGVKTGGGSRKGKPNKATAAKAAAIAASGLTPLDFLLNTMRDEDKELGTRLDAAKAAAQYVHPKLQPVDGKTGSSEIQARVRVEFVSPNP
jgi:hypothetical protein